MNIKLSRNVRDIDAMKIEMDKIKTVQDVCERLTKEINSFESEMKKDREDIKSLKLDAMETDSKTNELKKEVDGIKKTLKYIINEVTQNKQMMAQMQTEMDEESNRLRESKKEVTKRLNTMQHYVDEAIRNNASQDMTEIISGIERKMQGLEEKQRKLEIESNSPMMAQRQTEMNEEMRRLQESKKAMEDYIGENVTDIIPGIEKSLQELCEKQLQLEEKQRDLELGHFVVHNQVQQVTNVASRVNDNDDMSEDVEKMNNNPIYRFESGSSLLKILIKSQNPTYSLEHHYTIIKLMTTIIEDCEKKIKKPTHHKTKDKYHWIIKDLKKMRKYLEVTKGKKEHAIENGCAKVFIDHLNKFSQDYKTRKKISGMAALYLLRVTGLFEQLDKVISACVEMREQKSLKSYEIGGEIEYKQYCYCKNEREGRNSGGKKLAVGDEWFTKEDGRYLWNETVVGVEICVKIYQKTLAKDVIARKKEIMENPITKKWQYNEVEFLGALLCGLKTNMTGSHLTKDRKDVNPKLMTVEDSMDNNHRNDHSENDCNCEVRGLKKCLE